MIFPKPDYVGVGHQFKNNHPCCVLGWFHTLPDYRRYPSRYEKIFRCYSVAHANDCCEDPDERLYRYIKTVESFGHIVAGVSYEFRQKWNL